MLTAPLTLIDSVCHVRCVCVTSHQSTCLRWNSRVVTRGLQGSPCLLLPDVWESLPRGSITRRTCVTMVHGHVAVTRMTTAGWQGCRPDKPLSAAHLSAQRTKGEITGGGRQQHWHSVFSFLSRNWILHLLQPAPPCGLGINDSIMECPACCCQPPCQISHPVRSASRELVYG